MPDTIDIDKWIEQLAGRVDMDESEMLHVRKLILRQDEDAQSADKVDVDNDLHLIALLSRLRRDGVLDEDTDNIASTNSLWWSASMKVGYALVLVVGFVMSFILYESSVLYPHASFNIASIPAYKKITTRGALKNTAISLSEIKLRVSELKRYSIPYELIKAEHGWELRFFIADIQRDDASVWVAGNEFFAQPNGWVVIFSRED